jgi:hypothetical protein
MDRKKETQKRMLEFMEWARNSPPSNPARSGPHREFKPDPVISGLPKGKFVPWEILKTPKFKPGWEFKPDPVISRLPKGKFVPWEILKTPKFKPVDLFDCRSAPPEQPAQSLADDDNSKSQ